MSVSTWTSSIYVGVAVRGRGARRSLPGSPAVRPNAVATRITATKVSIRTLPTPVEFGQSIAVVSNANAWETGTATELSWTEGDIWQGELEVPSDVANLEFKLVKIADGEVIEWEGGDNKSCAVSKGSKTLECSWGNNELTEKKATRKRSSSPKKKKAVAADAGDVVEEVSTTNVADPVAEIAPEAGSEVEQVFAAPCVAGDEIMYTFDESDLGESAADIARRMYGGM